MMNAVDYCIDHDDNSPDFIQQLIDAKLCRSTVSKVAGGDGDQLND